MTDEVPPPAYDPYFSSIETMSYDAKMDVFSSYLHDQLVARGYSVFRSTYASNIVIHIIDRETQCINRYRIHYRNISNHRYWLFHQIEFDCCHAKRSEYETFANYILFKITHPEKKSTCEVL
jgi:hypothetical protein